MLHNQPRTAALACRRARATSRYRELEPVCDEVRQKPDARRGFPQGRGRRSLLNLCLAPLPIRPCRSPRWPGYIALSSRPRTSGATGTCGTGLATNGEPSDYEIVSFPKDG